MIGEAEFACMKESARMIIVSRGGIVSEDALAGALRAGRIAGAVVDCYVQEPLPPKHPFFAVPNLAMTPHMSGVYEPFWPEFVRLLAENLRRFVSGSPLLNLANHRHGY
jgi:phosphoglycerate dehydrogenase-like enzyme